MGSIQASRRGMCGIFLSIGGSRGGARGARPPPRLIRRPNWGPKARKKFFLETAPSPYLRVWMTGTRKLPTSQTPGRMGTSFGRSECLRGQALVMIGWRYSSQPLTNHKYACPPWNDPRNRCADSLYPFPLIVSWMRNRKTFQGRGKRGSTKKF